MRRKPVRMVGVTAVLLSVGVIATGQAAAGARPKWPDVRGFSLAGRSDVRGRAQAQIRVQAQAQHAKRPTVAQRGDRAPAAHAVRKQWPAPTPAVTDAQTLAAAAGRPAVAVPVRPKPPLVAPDAVGRMVAAARENVTPSDVSTSPGAPVQQQILTLINQDRRRHGCGRLTLDRRLIGAADAHAADMARHNYFAHESRDGTGAGDRVRHAGYRWSRYGENIARGAASPHAVVDSWMNSPEHRHNILDCSLDQMGVGLAIAGDKYRTVYWVQDFATPM